MNRQRFDLAVLKRLCIETTPSGKYYLMTENGCKCVMGDVLEVYGELNPGYIVSIYTRNKSDRENKPLYIKTSDGEEVVSSLPDSLVEAIGWENDLGSIPGLNLTISSLSDNEAPKPLLGAVYLGFFADVDTAESELYRLQKTIKEKVIATTTNWPWHGGTIVRKLSIVLEKEIEELTGLLLVKYN